MKAVCAGVERELAFGLIPLPPCPRRGSFGRRLDCSPRAQLLSLRSSSSKVSAHPANKRSGLLTPAFTVDFTFRGEHRVFESLFYAPPTNGTGAETPRSNTAAHPRTKPPSLLILLSRRTATVSLGCSEERTANEPQVRIWKNTLSFLNTLHKNNIDGVICPGGMLRVVETLCSWIHACPGANLLYSVKLGTSSRHALSP